MASRPFLRAFRLKLKENGGWTALLERIADGTTLTKVAQEYGCSVSWLCHQLRDDPERLKLYEEAKKVSAAVYHAKAQDVLEDADVYNRESVAKAKLLAEHFRWTASRYDREQFGETQPNQVAETVGNLLLDALRRRAVGSVSSTAVEATVVEQAAIVAPVTRQ